MIRCPNCGRICDSSPIRHCVVCELTWMSERRKFWEGELQDRPMVWGMRGSAVHTVPLGCLGIINWEPET